MAVIVIRERDKTETGFNATLIIAEDSYPIIVSDPFNIKQEQELEWYFENWIDYPMLDNIKANRAKASIREHGEELFRLVFQSNSKAYSKYSELKTDLSHITIEIASITPEFQAIHWEALRDPELTDPFAIDTILIRKSIQPQKVEIEVRESPTINLLVVVARPNAEDDIPHRTISRPLVETIRRAKLRVNIEILRPGTYEALAKHLEAKGNGYYHIVHFDVHGSLQNYTTYQERIEIGVYPESRYGREEIKEYDGFKAFLALEGEEVGEYDPVEASEIANLLTSKDIPVCILNACQSGKQLRSPLTPFNQGGIEDNRETSLGSRLLNAGMQIVVAMSYSVTVTAAEIMMQQLYEHLFDQQDINQAILLGRKELYKRKSRQAAYNTKIDLEDWLLPVVYGNGKVTFNLREFTPEEATEYNLNLASKYKFAEPNYGFVGRDIDILLIEKALLQHNILLLQGMGGTGKTTLLSYLREWWQVTKFAEDTFYFAYDRRAYTLQQIIFKISKQIYNQFDLERFQAKAIREQCQDISHKLRTNSYVLILDNLESITGKSLAIQNTLESAEKEEIKNFLASLVSGKTKVVLGSRIAEEWLKASTFQDNSYQLRGLDAQASSDLAANILEEIESSQSLEEIKTDEYFKRLMRLLAGNPLAIKVILPNLKDKSPKKVLEQLEKAEIDPGGDDKESNIIKCIEYSYSNLSESSQKLLLLFAPFQGSLISQHITLYAQELEKIDLFQDYKLDRLESAVDEACTRSLLSFNQDTFQVLTIHPLLSYFLNNKLNKVSKEIGEAIKEGFKNTYIALSFYLNKLLESKEAHKKQIGITVLNWEYTNFNQGLKICLERKESVSVIWTYLFNYLFFVNDKNEQLLLNSSLYQNLSKLDPIDRYKEWQTDIFTIESSLARSYQEIQNYSLAKKTYKNALNSVSDYRNIEKPQKEGILATIYQNLGTICYELGEYHQAREYCKLALDLYIKDRDRPFLALVITYNSLGLVAHELREYHQAREHFQLALDICIKNNEIHFQARIYHNLGYVCQVLREYQQAKKYYQQSIDIRVEYEDYYPQLKTYNNLGLVADELKQYQQARKYYQKALDICIEYDDRYFLPRLYNNLGKLSLQLGEVKQAENYLQKAISLKSEYGDPYSQAKTYYNLGIIALFHTEQYQQGQDYLKESLNIFIEYNDLHSQTEIKGLLGMSAEAMSEFEQAKSYYLETLKAFWEFKDQYFLSLTIENIAILYSKTKDRNLIKDVASVLDRTESEIEILFQHSQFRK